MGLDFSHGDAAWAYRAFQCFREALAKHEGFDLNEMEGFFAPWRGHDRSTFPNRSWDEVDTPLEPLLNHDDNEGELTPDECRQVAPRLREVVPVIWPDADDREHRKGMALAEGMEMAAALNEPLEFW